MTTLLVVESASYHDDLSHISPDILPVMTNVKAHKVIIMSIIMIFEDVTRCLLSHISLENVKTPTNRAGILIVMP